MPVTSNTSISPCHPLIACRPAVPARHYWQQAGTPHRPGNQTTRQHPKGPHPSNLAPHIDTHVTSCTHKHDHCVPKLTASCQPPLPARAHPVSQQAAHDHSMTKLKPSCQPPLPARAHPVSQQAAHDHSMTKLKPSCQPPLPARAHPVSQQAAQWSWHEACWQHWRPQQLLLPARALRVGGALGVLPPQLALLRGAYLLRALTGLLCRHVGSTQVHAVSTSGQYTCTYSDNRWAVHNDME
jgi:hypothetical protein